MVNILNFLFCFHFIFVYYHSSNEFTDRIYVIRFILRRKHSKMNIFLWLETSRRKQLKAIENESKSIIIGDNQRLRVQNKEPSCVQWFCLRKVVWIKKQQQIMLWLLPVEFFFVQIFRTSKSRIHCFSIFGVILFVFVSTKVTSNDKIHVKSNWMISFKCACIFAWPKVISAKRPIFPSPKPISVIIFLTYVFKLLPYCVLMMIGSTELKIRHIRRFFMFLLWSSRLPVHCVSDQNAIEIINVFELRRALDYTVLKCLRPHTSKWQT